MITYIQEKGNESALDGLVPPGRLDDIIEEIVASLDLVPEEEVPLRELEVVDVQLLHEGDPDDVEGGEDPAPARVLLVGDGLPLVLHLVVEHVLGLLEPPPRQRDLEGVVPRADVLREHVLRGRVERGPEVPERLPGQRGCEVM